MIPDPLSRTVKIPIKIVNGHPCLFPDGKLPDLKDGTIGDLVVPAHSFSDPKIAAQFAEEHREPFLPVGTRLAAQINPEHVPEQHRKHVEHSMPGYMGAAVVFTLAEDQQILRRGTKSAELLPCRCTIPSLGEDAKSVNHAYTMISQAYEPHRISHTGNVFTKVYYLAGNTWKPLKELRGY